MRLKEIFIFAVSLFFSFLSEGYADFSFKGQLDFPQKELELTFDIPQPVKLDTTSAENVNDHGSILIKAEQTLNGEYHISLDIGHLRTPQFYFSGNIQGIIQILDHEIEGGNFIEGQWWGKKPVVNFETFNDISGRFKMSDQRFYLKSFSSGDILGKGYMDLKPPYKMDFDVNLSSIAMKDFLSFWMQKKEEDAAGNVSGNIKISGDLQKLALQGKLESFDGFVQQLKFDSLYLDIEGIYPKLTINQESTISKSDGLSYNFQGLVDLNDIENFKNQLEKLTVSPLVNETKSGKEWTIKRVREGDASTEFKYLLRKDDKNSSDSDMLGVERSIKF